MPTTITLGRITYEIHPHFIRAVWWVRGMRHTQYYTLDDPALPREVRA